MLAKAGQTIGPIGQIKIPRATPGHSTSHLFTHKVVISVCLSVAFFLCLYVCSIITQEPQKCGYTIWFKNSKFSGTNFIGKRPRKAGFPS